MSISSDSHPEEDDDAHDERVLRPIQDRAAEAAASSARAVAAAAEDDVDDEQEAEVAASSLTRPVPPHLAAHRVYKRLQGKTVQR